MSGGCQGLVKPKDVKPKIPKGGSHKLHWLAYIAHSKLRKCVLTCSTTGLRLYRPKSKAKVQTKPMAVAAAPAQTLAQAQLRLRLPKVSRPLWRLWSRGRKDWLTPGLLSAWGWCLPVLFVQINLRQNLSIKKICVFFLYFVGFFRNI